MAVITLGTVDAETAAILESRLLSVRNFFKPFMLTVILSSKRMPVYALNLIVEETVVSVTKAAKIKTTGIIIFHFILIL